MTNLRSVPSYAHLLQEGYRAKSETSFLGLRLEKQSQILMRELIRMEGLAICAAGTRATPWIVRNLLTRRSRSGTNASKANRLTANRIGHPTSRGAVLRTLHLQLESETTHPEVRVPDVRLPRVVMRLGLLPRALHHALANTVRGGSHCHLQKSDLFSHSYTFPCHSNFLLKEDGEDETFLHMRADFENSSDLAKQIAQRYCLSIDTQRPLCVIWALFLCPLLDLHTPAGAAT